MAYLPFDDEDETLSTAALGQQGQASAIAGPTVAYNPADTGRFTNFSGYFNAAGGQQKGDALVGSLGGNAQGAQGGLSTAATGVASETKAGTLRGPGAYHQHTGRDYATQSTQAAQRAQTQAGLGYSGPSSAEIATTFQPLQQQATTAAKNINLSRDAAGVKAVQGGTGFDATLAHAGAGGRLRGLRQKYGRLGQAAQTQASEAFSTAQKAAKDSAANASAWGNLAGAYRTDAARTVSVDPPTDEPGRWVRGEGGWWSENPGWGNRPRQPVRGLRQGTSSTGVTVYG